MIVPYYGHSGAVGSTLFSTTLGAGSIPFDGIYLLTSQKNGDPHPLLLIQKTDTTPYLIQKTDPPPLQK